MANKTLNTRQKQIFRAPQNSPMASRGQPLPQSGKKLRHVAPVPKPDTRKG